MMFELRSPCGCSGYVIRQPAIRHPSMLLLPQGKRTPRMSPIICLAAPPDPPDAPAAGSDSSPGPGPSLLDPVQTITWGGTLPSTRRAVLGGLGGVAISLGGNLGGVSSWLLGLDGGQLAGRLRADVLVPVRGAKRCVESKHGFEFTYPASWLADQTLANRAARRAEAERGGPPGLNLDPLDDYEWRQQRQRRRRRPASVGKVAAVEPVVAFGPPATTGEENVSVIVAPITPGFTLRSMGDPRVAGERLLASLAPEGSGLVASLLGAEERTLGQLGDPRVGSTEQQQGQQQEQEGQQGQLYYTLEYTVQGPRFFRHNLSVYTTRKDMLYTFNAQCPEARWQEDAAVLRASAASFRLLL
ncbi:hypothetical protein Agub_g9440 [Astrephomene gubernaculifera]|uniref:PsbP C-terminal domain-containing protein n=1 Tax=Astrephomene gubernaculifera TaxID=47775 RepID=A0AAD3HP33_9CHLO|nr:hypothetical protein Agub_g9440 [Astrephomene gubernaculifera]